MSSKDHFTLTAVQARPGQHLHLIYADGQSFDVDLSDWIGSSKALAPLQDSSLFAQARVGFQGRTVDWIEDELDLAADNLRNMAVEQAGGIGSERLANWMHKHGLTQERAADAIGVSRRMLNYYLSGAKAIPKTVWLACLGWEAMKESAPA